ncbi:MAG: hypothetical protein IMF11_10805 [Proteobacteria bacterium]|nr:hypothetical protein [Pseudomonadota bacterium]
MGARLSRPSHSNFEYPVPTPVMGKDILNEASPLSMLQIPPYKLKYLLVFAEENELTGIPISMTMVITATKYLIVKAPLSTICLFLLFKMKSELDMSNER